MVSYFYVFSIIIYEFYNLKLSLKSLIGPRIPWHISTELTIKGQCVGSWCQYGQISSAMIFHAQLIHRLNNNLAYVSSHDWSEANLNMPTSLTSPATTLVHWWGRKGHKWLRNSPWVQLVGRHRRGVAGESSAVRTERWLDFIESLHNRPNQMVMEKHMDEWRLTWSWKGGKAHWRRWNSSPELETVETLLGFDLLPARKVSGQTRGRRFLAMRCI